MRVPEPKQFSGSRDAKELEIIFGSILQSRGAMEEDQVTMATMSLSGDAKLWWRTRCEDEPRSEINTWAELKRELKEPFLPGNVAWIARQNECASSTRSRVFSTI